MQERRRRPATELTGYLHQLPALLLLDRLPAPMLGVGPVGEIVYANPACVDLLGYSDAAELARLHLPDLLDGHDTLAPSACLDTLRAAEGVIGWKHAENYVVRTVVSPPLLVRESDPLLLISITDVTDWLWESKPVASADLESRPSP